ncbi:MAG TPA: CHAT domain-containing protein [Candidatus Cybelea sp.]|jgi:hypothetical protein|nr:CHAT domain-containing protein [Candidatus Cybelea sp.]
MTTNFETVVEEYAQQPDSETKARYLFAHPSLFSKTGLDRARENLQEPQTLRALEEIERIRQQIQGGAPFFLGTGPIEQTWEMLERGEITMEEAVRRVCSPDVVAPLAYLYVRGLSKHALSILSDRWRQALNLQTLLLAATQAAGEDPEALRARVRANMDFITVATRALIELPDGRVYTRASAAAQWLRNRSEQNELWPPGELDFRLGVINLDPYFFGGDVVNYQRSLNAWRNRLRQELGPEFALIPAGELAVPGPADALAKAVACLTDAVKLRPNWTNAEKALVQALQLRAAISGESESDELSAASAKLGADASPEQNTLAYLSGLDRALAQHGVEPAEAECRVLDLLAAPDALIKREGVDRTVEVVLDALLMLGRLASSSGFEVVERYRACVMHHGSALQRRQFWDRELALFSSCMDSDEASPARLMPLVAQAQRERREYDALAAVDRLRRAHPEFAETHADALRYLQYLLVSGLATNSFEAKKYAAAISYYGQALSYCLALGFLDEALTYGTRIDDLASHDDPDVAATIAAVLLSFTLRFEALLGEPAMRLVQSMCKKSIAGMVAKNVSGVVYASIAVAGKGSQFTAATLARARFDVNEDGEARALLERIAALEAVAPAQFDRIQNEEEMLLSSFIESTNRESGSEPVEQLRNLQRAFDSRVGTTLAVGSMDRVLGILTPEQIQASLDERTVLLDYFLGATPDGRVATMVMLVSKELTRLTAIAENFPAGLIAKEVGELRAFTPPIGAVVEARRAGVTAEPGPRLVDRDAADGLTADLRRYLGPFVELLADLHRRGKDALVIVPHGPLHFYPWSLLGGPDHPLANDWTITVAPSLGILFADAPAQAANEKSESSVVGLSFAGANQFGLPPIPWSAGEAQHVAATLGVEPMLDDAATKRNVLAALTKSRYAHISTHGRHAVAAPAFQCIYLAHDGGHDDGRLFAYELLDQDLRGLELLTLSACETALGRYDLGDNLRGLPSAFFLAGVQTVVGTLWTVDASATELFFPCFYAAIQQGRSHRDAFRAAQIETRKAFPKLRDWGAFYLMGRST